MACVQVRLISKTKTKAPIVLTLPTIWFLTNILLKIKVSSTSNKKATRCWRIGEKPSRPSTRLKIGVTGSLRPIIALPDTNEGIHKAIANKAITTY